MSVWKQTNNHRWWWENWVTFQCCFVAFFFWGKRKNSSKNQKTRKSWRACQAEEKVLPSTYFYDQTFEFKLRSRQRYGESKETLNCFILLELPENTKLFFLLFLLLQASRLASPLALFKLNSVEVFEIYRSLFNLF